MCDSSPLRIDHTLFAADPFEKRIVGPQQKQKIVPSAPEIREVRSTGILDFPARRVGLDPDRTPDRHFRITK
jgi:hypothetical protein